MNKAGLNLLPRKEFELLMPDGTTINGQFGTWALSRFGEKKKLSLSKLTDYLMNSLTTQDVLEFILCAIEYKERASKKPSVFTDIQLCEWIDAYTYDTGEAGVLDKLFSHAHDVETEKKSPLETATA